MQPPVAVARLLPRQHQQLRAQCRVPVRPRLVAIASTFQVKQLAGRALAQAVFGLNQRHIFSQAGKLQPFFLMTAFSASPCRLSSATKSFRRRFSSSICFSRSASFTSKPPYFCFHW